MRAITVVLNLSLMVVLPGGAACGQDVKSDALRAAICSSYRSNDCAVVHYTPEFCAAWPGLISDRLAPAIISDMLNSGLNRSQEMHLESLLAEIGTCVAHAALYDWGMAAVTNRSNSYDQAVSLCYTMARCGVYGRAFLASKSVRDVIHAGGDRLWETNFFPALVSDVEAQTATHMAAVSELAAGSGLPDVSDAYRNQCLALLAVLSRRQPVGVVAFVESEGVTASLSLRNRRYCVSDLREIDRYDRLWLSVSGRNAIGPMYVRYAITLDEYEKVRAESGLTVTGGDQGQPLRMEFTREESWIP